MNDTNCPIDSETQKNLRFLIGLRHEIEHQMAHLDDRQKRIMDLVRKRGRISRAKCISMLKISRATATRDLSHLVRIGLLEAKGKGAATYYVLTGS